MIRLLHFVAFQAAWFAVVFSATEGRALTAFGWTLAFLALHLGLVPRGPERWLDARYLALAALFGTLADALLQRVGATAYPTHEASLLPPLWIGGLWASFAALSRFSLFWLLERPWLAALLGALGGPLSYWGGVRIGAVAAPQPALTTTLLALEYAIATPLLLSWAPVRRRAPR